MFREKVSAFIFLHALKKISQVHEVRHLLVRQIIHPRSLLVSFDETPLC